MESRMGLKLELQRLRLQCLAEFDSLDEFVQHTRAVWDAFGLTEKHPKDSGLSFRNTRTGQAKTIAEICDLYEKKYERNYLLALTFQQIVSLFENFFFDFLRLLLLDDPQHRLSKAKKLDVELILSVHDYPSILEIIVDRELNELK